MSISKIELLATQAVKSALAGCFPHERKDMLRALREVANAQLRLERKLTFAGPLQVKHSRIQK